MIEVGSTCARRRDSFVKGGEVKVNVLATNQRMDAFQGLRGLTCTDMDVSDSRLHNYELGIYRDRDRGSQDSRLGLDVAIISTHLE